jgi:hypothetical protein
LGRSHQSEAGEIVTEASGGAEGEVADRVEHGHAFDELGFLDNVQVVPDHEVKTSAGEVIGDAVLLAIDVAVVSASVDESDKPASASLSRPRSVSRAGIGF